MASSKERLVMKEECSRKNVQIYMFS